MADGRELAFIGSIDNIGTSSVLFAGGLKADNVALRTIWRTGQTRLPSIIKPNWSHVDGVSAGRKCANRW